MKFVRTSAALAFSIVLAVMTAVIGFLVGGSADAGTSTSTASPSASTAPSATGTASGSPSASAAADAPVTQDLRYPVSDSTDITWNRQLPLTGDGAWALTWSATIEGLTEEASAKSPLKVECYVVQGTATDFTGRTFYTAADSATTRGAGEVSMSGAGVVDLADGPVVAIECELNNGIPRPVTWGTNRKEPIQVTATPIASYAQSTP